MNPSYPERKYKYNNLFYHNSWEMKFILSTQGASRAGYFFSPLNVRECFFGQRSYAGSFSYLCALPGYTVYMYMFFLKSTSPSPPSPPPPPPAPEMVRPTNRGISHVSYFLYSRNMCSTSQFRSHACSLYKEFFHLCRINANR